MSDDAGNTATEMVTWRTWCVFGELYIELAIIERCPDLQESAVLEGK